MEVHKHTGQENENLAKLGMGPGIHTKTAEQNP